jgi:hypothetical protein
LAAIGWRVRATSPVIAWPMRKRTLPMASGFSPRAARSTSSFVSSWRIQIEHVSLRMTSATASTTRSSIADRWRLALAARLIR